MRRNMKLKQIPKVPPVQTARQQLSHSTPCYPRTPADHSDHPFPPLCSDEFSRPPSQSPGTTSARPFSRLNFIFPHPVRGITSNTRPPSRAHLPNNPMTSTNPLSSIMSPSHLSTTPSLSPSLSPQRTPPPTDPELARPLAMRLSQLVSPEPPVDATSTQLVSPLRLKPAEPHSRIDQMAQGFALKMAAAPMPLTEPVTPPFSPPVLPPLSSVTGMPGMGQAVSDRRGVLQGSWTSGGGAASPVKNALPNPMYPDRTTSSRVYAQPSTHANNNFYQPSPPRSTLPNYPTPDHTSRSTNTTAPAKKLMKRPYKKYYSNPTPSSHCHVCARTSKAVKFAVCARIQEGLCRKVTCYKCFVKFGWDWSKAVDNPEWICVHCRGECPEGRSQCYIYSRVNSKRESKRGAKKAAKLAAAAAAAAAAASANAQRLAEESRREVSRVSRECRQEAGW